MNRLQNKVALVTGGSRGIGAAIVLRLAEEGADIAINYTSERSEALANAVKEQVTALDRRAIVVRGDVGVKADVEAIFEKVEQELGDVDILVNNAGVAPFEPFMSVTEETWDRTMNTNLKSVFLCSQRAARGMIERRSGKIVNVLSTASLVVTSPAIPHYQSSKAGAHMLTKGMAIELGQYNINVNAVGPSTVDTDMCTDFLGAPGMREREEQANPMKRIGTARQIGDAVVFLASEEAMQINGHLLMVDGGLSVKAAQPEDHMER
ncbi:SDR family NAD(P)-dependent oxidoreductase [Paenibacillus sp. MMS18-CY102]|uniref:SDR family NAD(P)-dependent oxidoreductase n=1 Tax=Paenibacillus sp. MMS18-CY102 TaxID=2682849 RepID=UPI0013655CA2|nr:3-oxoacyl-ACP reductase family protein [Paenibacillus sp. MMS18-CY102]MWC28685.1 glucose 1-dehydrogenase [Paenibacillus sp. MMS18-CY102]